MRLHAVLPLIQQHPAFAELVARLRATARPTAAAIATGRGPRLAVAEPARLSVLDAAKPAVLAALQDALGQPLVLLTTRPGEARLLAGEVRAWSAHPESVLLFPELDALPYERLAPDPDRLAERLAVLARLALAAERPGSEQLLVVTSVRAVGDLLLAPSEFARARFTLRVGDRVPLRALLERLRAAGYEPAALVDTPGTFARRGGIVDLYPPAASGDDASAGPVRVELWGDDVESIRRFDPATQRSTARLAAVTVPPAHEVLPGPAGARAAQLDCTAVRAAYRPPFEREIGLLRAGQAFPELEYYRGFLGSATLLDYLPAGGLLVLDEPAAVARLAADLERQAEELHADLLERGEVPRGLPRPYRPLAALLAGDDPPRLRLEHDPDAETVPCVHPPAFGGRLRQFLDHLAPSTSLRRPVEGGAPRGAEVGGVRLIVSQQASRLAELLAERGRPIAPASAVPPLLAVRGAGEEGPLCLVHGTLRAGWQSKALGVAVFTDNEIFGLSKTPRAEPRRAGRAAAADSLLADLQPGDYVVHVDHGIGRYRGLVRLPAEAPGVGGQPADGRAGTGPGQGATGAPEREYLLIEYAEGDRLYVPADQADRVSRYIGATDAPPHLTRLNTGEWQRVKQRVRRAVRAIAQDLVELYASRELAPGHAFGPDSAWQHELEASFPYVETPDQLAAIGAVKADMERPRPMDRLVVGDVGYGKTEVALRAAFKAVNDGKQVAVLVPTTVLAQQHYHTFCERLSAFPVTVEMLSRFRSEKEQRAIVEGLKTGRVDIVIGTHRLVQKDVQFKDLGLVIIDEEQRFGVQDKERLKQLRKEVDVLTLTATPIPRTLHMALVGVRDLSTIQTPPEERRPIRTYVLEYDEGVIREAIVRELDRGGQVYFVHNRVQNIEFYAGRVRRLVPTARVAVAHGQMPEEQLERVMLDFAAGAYDVLVCTTIIESGLDIPNANTLIVNNAHRFGLAQLYQLRGRVGRSAQRAYAYFLYSRDLQLGEAAEKRLRTIFEATELGAGFRIALKDLEIRGAGNLLGVEQHGHISAVGFDLYARLLGEAVEQLKALVERDRPAGRAGAPRSTAPLRLDLPLDDFIPADYVPDEAQRLNLYQRLAAVGSSAELGELVAEIVDRFGPAPLALQNRVYQIELRLAAEQAGVTAIESGDGEIVVRFERLPPVDVERLARLVGAPLKAGSNQLRLPRGRGDGWMARLQTLIEALPRA